jgi:hypothetical protein
MKRETFAKTVPYFLILASLSLAGCAQISQAVDQAAAGIDTALQKVEGQFSAPDERFRQAEALAAQGDQAGAATIHRDLAQGGYAPSAFALGQAYEAGAGVPRDLDLAAQWYQRAVNLGSPQAQYMVGRINAEGAGVPQSDEKAARMFAKAAVQGYAPAQYRLGRAFANGEGVRLDRLWAGRWYGKAARLGNVDAQFAYGVMLASGRDIPRDLGLAHALLTLAKGQGVTLAAPVLNSFDDQMTADLRASSTRHQADIQGPPEGRFADKPTVRYVQAALGRLGVPAGPVDGLMGTKTRSAIQRFQEGQGMAADGVLDEAFLTALFDAAGDVVG